MFSYKHPHLLICSISPRSTWEKVLNANRWYEHVTADVTTSVQGRKVRGCLGVTSVMCWWAYHTFQTSMPRLILPAAALMFSAGDCQEALGRIAHAHTWLVSRPRQAESGLEAPIDLLARAEVVPIIYCAKSLQHQGMDTAVHCPCESVRSTLSVHLSCHRTASTALGAALDACHKYAHGDGGDESFWTRWLLGGLTFLVLKFRGGQEEGGGGRNQKKFAAKSKSLIKKMTSR